MNRILVIGDLLTDHYRFLKPLRSDPANNVALVVESEREEEVDGGAGNLMRNLKSLCGEDVHFWYGTGKERPTKIRYYVDDRFILREDRNDIIEVFAEHVLRLEGEKHIDEWYDEVMEDHKVWLHQLNLKNAIEV